MNIKYVVKDLVTGLVDGYYTTNRDALQAALHWEERLGHPMSVTIVVKGPYIPDAMMMNKYVPDEEPAFPKE